eukprot:SAG11_NODE_28630_length_319_cov_1.322727_1_plen_44_part_00
MLQAGIESGRAVSGAGAMVEDEPDAEGNHEAPASVDDDEENVI